MKEWEDYEAQIFKKIKSEFPETEVLKNQKIQGYFSKQKRQIDILVKGNFIGKDIIGVVECKNFNKKIDVKVVDSFIGFIEDVKANIGIIITNKGYTKAALNRVTGISSDIRLDIVEFIKLEEYHFTWDECEYCAMNDKPSEISWGSPVALVKDDVVSIIKIGQCDFCSAKYLKCHECDSILDFENLEVHECLCGTLYSYKSHYIGSGMTEDEVIILRQEKTEPKFIDPNQGKLFD